MKVLQKSILDWRLFAIVLLMMVIPSLYNSYSIYLIGQWPPTEEGLPIASQWQFVQLLIEVIQESLVLPLFFYIGSYRQRGTRAIFPRIQGAMVTSLLILVIIYLAIQLLMPQFVEGMQTSTALKSQTIPYLRLRLTAAVLGVINMGLIVIFEALGQRRSLLALLILRLLFHLCFDALFFGAYSFSFGMGIKGVAWSNLLTECIVFIASIHLLNESLDIRLNTWFQSFQLSIVELYAQIGKWIALESSLRNLAYFVMILALINQLGGKEMGGYYLSMHLFWSFCLLPINTLAEVLKAQIGNAAHDINLVKNLIFKGSIAGILFISIAWLIVYLNLSAILAFFNNDPLVIQHARYSFTLLLFPYALLAINMLIDTTFIGLGQTRYLAYQSIITNLLVYGLAYLLYVNGLWIPDFDSILLLFGIGILVDSGLTGYYLFKILKTWDKLSSF